MYHGETCRRSLVTVLATWKDSLFSSSKAVTMNAIERSLWALVPTNVTAVLLVMMK